MKKSNFENAEHKLNKLQQLDKFLTGDYGLSKETNPILTNSKLRNEMIISEDLVLSHLKKH